MAAGGGSGEVSSVSAFGVGSAVVYFVSATREGSGLFATLITAVGSGTEAKSTQERNE